MALFQLKMFLSQIVDYNSGQFSLFSHLSVLISHFYLIHFDVGKNKNLIFFWPCGSLNKSIVHFQSISYN